MEKHTPGPWEYIPSTENHGPYVMGPYGGDVADCYTMSNPSALAVCNGGDSKPIPFQNEAADANARLIAAAPRMLEALQAVDALWGNDRDQMAALDATFEMELGTPVGAVWALVRDAIASALSDQPTPIKDHLMALHDRTMQMLRDA